MSKTPALILCALISCALWGSAFPSIKIGYRLFEVAGSDTGAQMLFAGLRFFLAGIQVLIFESIRRRKVILPNRTALPGIAVLSLFQTILQYAFFYTGLAHSTAVKGALITGTTTFFSILTAALLFRTERLSLLKLLGCLVGFAGLILVNLGGTSVSLHAAPLGDALMLLSALSSGISTACLKIFSGKHDPVMLSGWQFSLGGMVLMGIGAGMGGRLHPAGPSAFLLLLYMALISSVAYTLWGILLKYHPVSRVTVFSFTIPIFGVLLSLLFAGENSTLPFAVFPALVLVCAGILIVNQVTRREAPPQSE
ncbi:MAG: DMT family transporter [Eubacterium sp.]|jgi:drug/metabolite transporter (DMT)-like permease